ncbi:MAG: glycosyltransferase, partial [Acidobacteriota bacterium]
MKRVVHCIHGVGLGGAQQVVRHIVAQRSEEFEYRVLASMSGVFHEQIEGAGASVEVLPRTLPKFDPVWAMRLRSAMRRSQAQLVHAHLFGDSLHGYLAARSLGVPVVLTLHNVLEARSGIQRRGYRWLLGQPLTAVACAEFVRQSFLDHFGARAESVLTIQNAVDAPESAGDPEAARRIFEGELGVAPGRVILAGVGRMAPQKAFENLLEALAALTADRGPEGNRGPGAHLVLFGEGELRADLEAHAARLGLRDAVTFAGFRDDVRALMAAVDVVVFSSRQEGLPMVLLEAMAASRCVVATRVG